MSENNVNFIQQNSPDGGFLQSDEWRKFQESVGRKTYNISCPLPSYGHSLPQAGERGSYFWANVIEHKLPIVGKYFYIPRGPILENQNGNTEIKDCINELIDLAKSNKAGWIRIEPTNEEVLKLIKDNINYKIAKAPHDMQPKEILVMDIAKPEEEILAGMKQKTRYNIRLAEKKGVKIIEDRKYMNDFIQLTKIMAKRQKIAVHPEEYYRKMLEVIPNDILKLYIAEYRNRVIAANLVVFYGNTCTYLHGASDDSFRNVMAPHLLQWKQIQDAKKAGCVRYDFGGVKIQPRPAPSLARREIKGGVNSWVGITRFKLGFAPNVKPIEFPGSYDIIISPFWYSLYRFIQRLKSFIS